MPVNSFADFPMSWRPNRREFGPGPAYLELASRLEADIASGSLPPGTKLPPQRELADFLDLNFTTVTRAYDVCRERGLIYGVVGRGTFVAARERSAEGNEEIVDCGVVQGFAGLGGHFVSDAARTILARSSTERLFSYVARDGWPNHREAGARWLARAGVEAAAEQVMIFPGVQSALSTALLTLFRVGDALAVDRFTYSNLIHLSRLAHVRLVPIDGDGKGLLPEALREASEREPRLRGVFLMPYCANPTTVTLSESRKDALAEVARERNLVVLEDDVRLAQAPQDVRPIYARLPEATVYLSGSVRLVAPGLRVTYVACSDRLAERLRPGLHHLTIKASALEAEILSELVVSGMAERILAAKRKKARAANAVFDSVFGDDGGDPERMFRTLPCRRTAGTGTELEAYCVAKGVRICHSDRFAVRPGEREPFLRVSVSSAPDLKSLKRGLLCLTDKCVSNI